MICPNCGNSDRNLLTAVCIKGIWTITYDLTLCEVCGILFQDMKYNPKIEQKTSWETYTCQRCGISAETRTGAIPSWWKVVTDWGLLCEVCKKDINPNA